jgi:hypothetical protein
VFSEELEVLRLVCVARISFFDYVVEHLVLENGLIIVAEEHALVKVLEHLLETFV